MRRLSSRYLAVVLPVMTAAALSAEEKARKAPIRAGDGAMSDRPRAMKAGAVDFLEMPCKPEALLVGGAPHLGAARHSESLLVEIERGKPDQTDILKKRQLSNLTTSQNLIML